MTSKSTPKQSFKAVLPVIVLAQFFCTSLWFAGNAILPDLVKNLPSDPGFLAQMTSAVQFGFILGTLFYASFRVADRFSPSRVFFDSALLAALFNLALAAPGFSPGVILFFRFLTGFFLAGIYPVGMKIASDYFQHGLGKSLGYLVGALVLGTAFPHFLKGITFAFPWQSVVYATSALSLAGGLAMVWLVPDGPFWKSGQGQAIRFGAMVDIFRNTRFRAASLGYFGHMWELYSFWAFVPLMLATFQLRHPDTVLNVPLYSFLVIMVGGPACVVAGLLSGRFGPKKIATISLFVSGLCCLLSPLFLQSSSFLVLLLFLLVWGSFVIADSPLFSTLVAKNAPEALRGTALTLVNCIGFSITILSIQFINILSDFVDSEFVFTALALGPVLGLMSLLGKKGADE
ncbi:MFS transporter [Persicitalea jodogahamensis]|uniref:MFS transporter n=1 Tax=Persicitalea jodogahamensis TaxID=402147 RepID=UPI0016789B27|nr:MFS transporter [Persicitalea jodogahamensis]